MTGAGSISRVSVLIVCLLGGCASVDLDYPKQPSTALAEHGSTSLGRRFAAAELAHPGQSGFELIRRGDQAFIARVVLADMAEKTLDLQYYIWEPDGCGHELAKAVIRAADRGVRVRVLLDDHAVAKRDRQIAALSGHPNISVRAFNAFRNRDRLFDYATDFARVNSRMHNKAFVADNAMAIIGGRNIADEYFGLSEAHNYRDLDVACAGPVVREISEGFDAFWNSASALPYAAFVRDPPTEADAREEMRKAVAAHAGHQFPLDLADAVDEQRARIDEIAGQFVWAPARVLRDDADKLITRNRGVLDPLRDEIGRAEREALFEAAYFVPGQPAVDFLRRLTSRGVRVRLLTNSFASNDVKLVYAEYAKFRRAVLEAGVELHELRPDAAGEGRYDWRLAGSGSALHSKLVAIDGERVFIGSFNLDPRSAAINTEIGVLIESPAIASQLADFMDEGVEPANAHRVMLDERGRLTWSMIDEHGKVITRREEPHMTFVDHFIVGWMQLLPVRSQL